jgi:regulator of cell morphogenesis and NO signaling
LFQSNQYISEILEKDLLIGSFLYSKGINFPYLKNFKLEDLCRAYNLNSSSIIKEMNTWADLKNQPQIEELKDLPIDLLIAYLKDCHQKFLWQRLPFMQQVIESLNPLEYHNSELIKDLKFVFPIFAEDFIHHIHEEEDEVFSYILDLFRIAKRGSNPGKIFKKSSSICLYEIANHHLDDDDEMDGIRKLTSDYSLDFNSSLNLKVIYAELMEFEKELKRHARIENEILFPRAIELQKDLKEKVLQLSYLN